MIYHRFFWLLLTLFLSVPSGIDAQTRYYIYLKDKPHYTISDSSCYLSASALCRRAKQGIAVDVSDAPVHSQYLTTLKENGIQPKHTSKWLNCVSVSLSPEQYRQCMELPFVRKIEPIRPLQCKVSSLLYGQTAPSIRQTETNYLHQLGYLGSGKKIAVFDDGFFRLNEIPAFRHLFQNGQILATRDFVDGDTIVYDSGPHGTNVISLMSAYLPDTFVGASYLSQYFLLRTENSAYERPIEEDNWIRAAEWADSAGAEIFQTSLNYNTFDDPRDNHTLSQLDGRTIPMSLAATIAARKGILVVNSAGNEGRTSWRLIAVPADADSILAVGGVDINRNIAPFSSTGPTADQRIKPDVVAHAQNIAVVNTDGGVRNGNGTSFSSPLIASLGSCLWQAVPKASAMQVREAILLSSDQYSAPDNIFGYGLPNGKKALAYLQSITYRGTISAEKDFSLSPNPCRDYIRLSAKNCDTSATWKIRISDLTGRTLYEENIQSNQSDWEHYIWRVTIPSVEGIFLFTVQNNTDNKIIFREKVIFIN